MSPRVLVIQPPLLLSSSFIDYPYFTSLGAYRAAAVLEGQGLEVEVLDAFDRPTAGLVLRGRTAWLGEPKQTFLARLADLEADLMLIAGSPFLMTWPGANWLSELIQHLKARGKYTVLADMVQGGMHYLDYQEPPGADLVLRYEGERLLARLAASIGKGERPGKVVWTECEPFPLDDLPAPAYHLMDTQAYFDFLGRVLSSSWRPGPIPVTPEQTLPLVTARGCRWNCVFCSKNPGLTESRHLVRNVPMPRVEARVTDWIERFGLRRLAVLDEVANLDAERFGSLLDLLDRLDLWVEFPNGLRADRLSEEQVIRLRDRTSGLKVSLESASPRVQREILKKNLDPGAVTRVSECCHRHGLPLEVHLIIGTPGERREEIVETLDMACRLADEHGTTPRLQFATPLPGTELSAICRERGYLTGQPEDLHAGFSQRGVIKTPEFDPDYLIQAKAILEKRLGFYREPKVIINLTYRCNNNCIFCAVADRERRDADTDEVISALGRYREAGYHLVDLDGGEPTLHPDLMKVIAEARSLDYRRITVITNGRRLSYPAFAETLAESGVDEVLVSLHAPESVLQARLTGVEASFAQTAAGLENILKFINNPERVGVNTTLVTDNLEGLSDLAEFLAGLGVRRWNLQVVTPFGRAKASQLPAEQELTDRLSRVLTDPPQGMQIQVINCPPCLLPGFEEAAAVDFQKSERDMVFVGRDGENLQAFLSRRRRPDRRCMGCLHSLLCPGFYEFEPDDPQ
jgi:MoaA/NifB/PqqE/SkfB family radical SAM enzyme